MPRTKSGRAAHACLPPPDDLRVAWLDAEQEQYAVLSYPVKCWSAPDGMTPAEQAVVLAVLQGATRSEIAAARNASVRTINNQLAQAFRKLGVRSRGEMAASLAGHD